MDIIAALNIFIVALIAIFFPFINLSKREVKLYLLMAGILFMAPLAFALAGNLLGWFVIYYVNDVILLQRGIFGISFAAGYGIIAGLLLFGLKVSIVSLFNRSKQEEIV